MPMNVTDKPAATVPREAMMRKPAHGSPCNRCGVCCMVTICQLGQHLFRREHSPGPCPALVADGNGEYACDVVRNPQAYAQALPPMTKVHALRMAARMIIFADDGCDARFNGEWINKRYHVEASIRDAKNKPKRDRALKLWGILK
jgi:hypothetical protein